MWSFSVILSFVPSFYRLNRITDKRGNGRRPNLAWARGDPLEVVEFWWWSGSARGFRFFFYFLHHWGIGDFPMYTIIQVLQLLALRPICCVLAMRWMTVTVTEDQQLMSVYIYILMIYHNGIDQLKDIDQWGRRMTGHVRDIEKVKLVKAQFWTLWTVVIKSPYLWHRLQRSRYMKSDIVRSDSCDWRTVRKNIALSRVQ